MPGSFLQTQPQSIAHKGRLYYFELVSDCLYRHVSCDNGATWSDAMLVRQNVDAFHAVSDGDKIKVIYGMENE
jgi:hypothetical protein